MQQSLKDLLAKVDFISDDELFMAAELEAVRDYWKAHNGVLTDEELSIIKSRGLEDWVCDWMTTQEAEKKTKYRKPITYIGRDALFRPVYKDECGTLYKDTDPRAHVPASLYFVKENVLEGAPDRVFNEAVRFKPKRITW